MNEVRYWLRKARGAFFYGPEEISRYIIIAKVALVLIFTIFFPRVPESYFVFSTTASLEHPWTFLTYPVATISLLELIFGSYWFWMVGSSLERSFPRETYIFLLGAITLIASASLFVGSMLWDVLGVDFLGSTNIITAGLWMPNAALTICWIFINPNVVLFPHTPFQLHTRQLFWAIVGLTLVHFIFMQEAPLLAPFSLIPLYFALRFIQRRSFVPSAKVGAIYQNGHFDPLKEARDWVIRQVLKLKRKLFNR